jgi:hypothetical protein
MPGGEYKKLFGFIFSLQYLIGPTLSTVSLLMLPKSTIRQRFTVGQIIIDVFKK